MYLKDALLLLSQGKFVKKSTWADEYVYIKIGPNKSDNPNCLYKNTGEIIQFDQFIGRSDDLDSYYEVATKTYNFAYKKVGNTTIFVTTSKYSTWSDAKTAEAPTDTIEWYDLLYQSES